MNFTSQLFNLIKKEFVLEWRQRFALSGILLYVLATVFIVYTSFVRVPDTAWNSTFWIIILFASVNAIAKSFIGESGNRTLYYYSLLNPYAVILSKMIYNTGLLLILCLLCYFSFSVIAGNPVKDQGLFFLILFLGGAGFSITFTFISAIAAKSKNNATLMAILSFPIIIPILMTLIKLSASALGMISDTAYTTDIIILIAIDMILVGMSLLLFPFLWRD